MQRGHSIIMGMASASMEISECLVDCRYYGKESTRGAAKIDDFPVANVKFGTMPKSVGHVRIRGGKFPTCRFDSSQQVENLPPQRAGRPHPLAN
jgi:hypothetical protein